LLLLGLSPIEARRGLTRMLYRTARGLAPGCCAGHDERAWKVLACNLALRSKGSLCMQRCGAKEEDRPALRCAGSGAATAGRTASEQDVGVGRAADVVDGRVGLHVLVVLRLVGVAPLLPLRRGPDATGITRPGLRGVSWLRRLAHSRHGLSSKRSPLTASSSARLLTTTRVAACRHRLSRHRGGTPR